MPQLMMRWGWMRMMAPPARAVVLPGSAMASARPRISRQRMRGGRPGVMSSMTTAARGLCWTLRYLRLAAMLWPPMSIVCRSAL